MLDEIDRFVKWTHRRNPAARTWRDYRSDLRQFAVITGDVPPGDVTVRRACPERSEGSTAS